VRKQFQVPRIRLLIPKLLLRLKYHSPSRHKDSNKGSIHSDTQLILQFVSGVFLWRWNRKSFMPLGTLLTWLWNPNLSTSDMMLTLSPSIAVHTPQRFLMIKPTRCTNFSNLFWKWNSTCCGQFLCPSSGVIHFTLSSRMCHTDSFRAGSGWNCISILILLLLESCLQTCMTYTTAVCTVNNSWWWTEEVSETCRVSFPK
jgi:hypothetical protein